MGRYFGKEPRYSREEAESQAKQAIDRAVQKGRPPDDEWKGLASRMGEINRELATRPPIDLPPPPPPRAGPRDPDRPRDIRQILRPSPPPAPEPEPDIAPASPPPPRAAAPARKRVAPAKAAAKAPAPARAAAKAPVKRTTKAAPAPAPPPAAKAKRAAPKKRS